MLDYQNLSTLEKIEGAIGNEQSREHGNSDTGRRQTKQKNTTQKGNRGHIIIEG
jgi:hypothetical protein